MLASRDDLTAKATNFQRETGIQHQSNFNAIRSNQ